MKIGTRSLLWGSHQFILHPLMVAYGWRRHHGFWPRSWKLWLCIVVHDWGYFGLDSMDGADGKHHPDRGARLAAWACTRDTPPILRRVAHNWWWRLCAAHSRHFAEIIGCDPSPLMIPDKLATALLPRWLYALLVWLSGEYREYVAYAVASGHDVPRDAWGYAGWIKAHWAAQFDREGGAG